MKASSVRALRSTRDLRLTPSRKLATARIVQPLSTCKPAQLDQKYFRMDGSVKYWASWHRTTDIMSVLQNIAAVSSRDPASAAYWAYHVARFSFFMTQGAASLLAYAATEYRFSLSGILGPGKPPLSKFRNTVGHETLERQLESFSTWQQDLAWIQAGKYKMPWDMVTPNKQYNPLELATRTARFLQESSATLARNERGNPDPVWLQGKLYPQYYTKTFHYQSDGWMSDWSADLYEHSTETLFRGRQDAMQRASLVPISDYISSSRVPASGMRLLEVAAGTGRFHTFIKDNWPEMRSVCSDLSPFYLQRARCSNLAE